MKRLVGDQDMQLIEARWDHVGTGERPLTAHDGWAVVDRVDIADLASERAHGWRGTLGRRVQGDPTARWSLVERETGRGHGLVIDGGRTIRRDGDGAIGETFAIELDPAKPTRLLLRTGGQQNVPWHETITKPVSLDVADADGRALAHVTVPPPTGAFLEVPIELPAHAFADAHPTIRVTASGPYRAYHWFVLQPS
jgi:hypothetical protein